MTKPRPNTGTSTWLLRSIGFCVSVLAGLSIFVGFYVAGYRGRGTITFSIMGGVVVFAIWQSLARTWASALAALLILAAAIISWQQWGYSESGQLDAASPVIVLPLTGLRTIRVDTKELACDVYCPTIAGQADLKLIRGRFSTEQEISSKSHVGLISQSLATVLLPAEDPIGKSIHVVDDGIHFRIIGVVDLGDSGQNAIITAVVTER